jgi:hypothetical protein
MNTKRTCLLLTLAFSLAAFAQSPPAPRVVDLKAADGTPLKATYFAVAKPGPGVLLLHQSNPGPQVLVRGSSAACGGWLQHRHLGHAWIR